MIKYIKIYYVILLMESHFLVSDYISKNSSNNVEELRKNLYTQGILSKDYPEEGLVLLYNRYENNNKNELQNECRSVILDRTSMDIVCYTCNTPICNMKALNFILSKNNSEMDFYKCYEGTLLSSFNHNGKWYLSTRRCLDSNNSKLNNMSHQDMFLEVLNQDGYESLEQFYEKLNPEYCYYFILIHNKNIHLVDYQKEFGDEYKKLCGDEWTPGKNIPFDPVATKLAAELGLTVKAAAGKDLPNLQKIFDGEAFFGTTIS